MELETKKDVEVKHSRFSDAPWFGCKENIVIGGVGGIGSWVALFLSRIGHNLYIFDMDMVDNTNMAGQCYAKSHIGKPKVEAVYEVCKEFSSEKININNKEYEDDSITSNIVIASFDNMKSRKVMFERWCQLVEATEDKSNLLFIDGRMTAETGQVYFITPERIERYKETLFDDSEVKPLPCSFKATTHNGAMIASQIVSGLNNHLANIALKDDLRDVPFSIKYGLEILIYKTEE